MLGSFVLHLDRYKKVRKSVLPKYRSFPWFWEPPILQGRIHVTWRLEIQVPGTGTWHITKTW